jgi:hypothetical protein
LAAKPAAVHVVASAEELPESLFGGPHARPERVRSRLRVLEQDARFRASYVGLAAGREMVAAVPVYEVDVPTWPPGPYDVGAIFATDLPPKRWAFVGGRADLSSGVLAVATGNAAALDDAPHRALVAAVDVVRARGRRPALLYAPEEMRAAASGAGAARIVQVGNRAVLEDVGADLESYLARLSHTHRRHQVRTDLKLVDRLGLHATTTRWENVLEQVAPLVVEVGRRYGGVDHPRLVAHRLREWTLSPEVERVAFALRRDGALYGASLALRHRDALYLNELGLPADRSQTRRTAYLELLFYAPLRYAWEQGLRRIDLGLAGEEHKARRGATLHPTWAIELES